MSLNKYMFFVSVFSSNYFTLFVGMEADEKLYNKLVSGYRMEQPQYAPEGM